MPREYSRRTLVKGATGIALLTGMGTTTVSCGLLAPPGISLLQSVATTAALAFGMRAGEVAAEALPNLFSRTVDRARQIADDGPILGRYTPGEIPENQLKSVVSALHRGPFDSGAAMKVTAVHGIQGYGLQEVPAIVQLGLNFLVLYLAEYDGSYFRPSDEFESPDLPDLRLENTIYAYSLVRGSEYINEAGTYRALTENDETIEIEWHPSPDDPTMHSRLIYRKGLVVRGRDPEWDVSRWVPVPFRYIFRYESPPPTVKI